MRGESFAKGAAILTLTGLAIRFLGAIYRIPLSWILGPRGLGIYGVPSQFYAMTFILATAGLPTAIAKLVAERVAQGDPGGAMRVFRVSRKLLFVAGICGALALALGARGLIALGVVQVPASYLGLLAIAPVLIVAPLASAYRGLFAGLRLMTPVAYSQFWDQIFNVLGTLGFAFLLLPRGLAWAAAGGNFGSFPGALAGFAVLLFAYAGLKKRGGLTDLSAQPAAAPESAAGISRRLIAIGVPISLASISLAIVGVLDNNIIIGGLVARGVARSVATAKYGQMSQLALPFVNAATSVAVAVAMNLVPAISRAFGMGLRHQASRLLSNALRLTLSFAAPIMLILFFWPAIVTGLLFKIPEAGVALRAVCPAIVFWSAYIVFSASLQGMGHPILPLLALLIGLAAKVGCGIYFIRLGWGIAGAGYATTIGYAITAAIALVELVYIRGIPIRPLLPVLGAILSLAPMALAIEGGLLFGGCIGLKGLMAPVFAAILGLLCYGAGLLVFGSVRREEIRRVREAIRRLLGR